MADLASVIRAHANDPVEIALNPGQYADAVRAVLNLHPHKEVPNFTVAGRPARACKSCGMSPLNQDWCLTVTAIARELGLSVEVGE